MKISEAPRYVRWLSWFPIWITRHLIPWWYWMEFHKPWPVIDQPAKKKKDATSA